MILLVLLVASVAKAEERTIGITGTVYTLGSSSDLNFYGEAEPIKPWSIGIMFADRDKPLRASLVVERFSINEKVDVHEMGGSDYGPVSYSKGGVVRSSNLAVRGQMTWETPRPKVLDKLGIRPIAGVFGGVALVTNHKAYEMYKSRTCLDVYLCVSGDWLELKPEEGHRPYLGVVVGAARRFSDNAEARLEVDAYSTHNRKLRANVTWWPSW